MLAAFLVSFLAPGAFGDKLPRYRERRQLLADASLPAQVLLDELAREIQGRSEAALRAAGAKTIGMDIIFAEPSNPGDDAALAAALAGKVTVDEDTVIMVTGGNTDAASFAATITAG